MSTLVERVEEAMPEYIRQQRARIVALEAENATLKQERDDLKDDYLRRHKEAVDEFDRRIAAEAERDRLRRALTWISELSPNGINIGAAIQEAQRSLSPSETEEGAT